MELHYAYWWEIHLRVILTHWGRETHICVSKLNITGSDNGLSPGRRQAIIWTNAGLLSIGPLGTNFSEISIGVQAYYHISCLHTLRPRQKGRHFANDTLRYIFLNENVIILVKISLKFVPKGSINNIPALVQIMAWRRPGDKPLSEPMLVRKPTHICVTRPKWVN